MLADVIDCSMALLQITLQIANKFAVLINAALYITIIITEPHS